MLTKTELLAFGYEILPDPENTGMFYWRNDQDTAKGSFSSEADAQLDATDDALSLFDIYHCSACGCVHGADHGVNVATCPHCSAEMTELRDQPDWEDVLAHFGLDDSFQWSAEQVLQYSRAYLGWSSTMAANATPI